MNKFLLLALVLLSIFGELNCNKYNNNYPNQRKDKEKQREICPYKKVRRQLALSKTISTCYQNYGKSCCNIVAEMITDPTLPYVVGNEDSSESVILTQALVESTTLASTTTTTSTSSTTTPSDEPIVGDAEEIIASFFETTTERSTTERSTTESTTTERSTTESTTTERSTTETISEANSSIIKQELPLTLNVIKEQLKEQVTNLLTMIDQTNSILAQREIEAQRLSESSPSVSASVILRITNSKLSPKDAIKALRILAYKRIAEQLHEEEK